MDQQNWEMTVLPKLIYISNVSYFRTPMAFFTEKNPIIHMESQKTLSRKDNVSHHLIPNYITESW